MKIFVVVPNWNGCEFLAECLRSLETQSLSCTTVVVDNASTDGSVELVEKQFPEVVLLRQEHNLGFAGGVNRGLEYGLEQGAQYIALFNNDAKTDKHWLEQLVAEMEAHPETGMVTGKLLHFDGKRFDSTGDFYTDWGFSFPRGRDELDRGQYQTAGEVFAASGGASLYRAQTLQEIGLFDEDFFAYFEDVDICFRAQLAGWRVRYNPAAVAFHHIGGTSSRISGFARYHSVKNFTFLYFKNMPGWLFWRYMPKFLFAILLMLGHDMLRGKLFTNLKAHLKVLKNIPSLLRKRRAIQRSRKVSVAYIDSILIHQTPPTQKKIIKNTKHFSQVDSEQRMKKSIFLRPDIVIYALAASLPWQRIPSFPVYGLNLRPSLVLGGLLIFITIKERPQSFPPNTLLKRLLYGFLGICLASSLLSAHPVRSLVVTAYTGFVILIAMAIAGSIDLIRLKTLAWVLAATTAVACLFGLYQFFGDAAGLPLTATGLKAAYSSGVFGFPRIQAASYEPLYFANFLLLPIALLAFLHIKDWFRLAGLTLVVTTLLLTLSRGGVVAGALILISAVIIHFSKRQFRIVLAIAAGTFLAAILALFALGVIIPALRHRPTAQPIATYTKQLGSYEVGSATVDRAKTRQMGIELFKSHPFIGAGPGSFGYYAHTQSSRFPTSQIVNNEPTEILAEEGLAGLLVLAIFGFTLTYKTLKTYRHKAAEIGMWQISLLLVLVGTAVQYWSFSTLYIVHIWVTVGLLMGMIGLTRYSEVK